MKNLIAQNVWSAFAQPLSRVSLPFIFTLAFLPSILRLLAFAVPAAELGGAGPLLAGFWFAAGFKESRLSYTWLATAIALLLWSANWLMLAGKGCCATM